MTDAAAPSTTALGSLRGPEVGAAKPLVIVPVGSVEQHGPHLPLSTDSLVATQVARDAAVVLAGDGLRIVVAPPLSYGASGEHEDFPGTISIGHEALYAVLVEIGRSACRWARGVIFLNGHGGNLATVVKAVELLRYEGRAVAWAACAPPGADAHAGFAETSLLLHLAPSTVRLDLAEAGAIEPIADLLPRLRDGGVRAVSPNGVLGDPAGSSAEEGARLHGALVDDLVARLRLLDVDALGRLTSRADATPWAASEAAR